MQEKYEIFTDYICNYIIPNKIYTKSFGIAISGNALFSIKYNHKLYNLNIIKIDGKLYWKLAPHFEDCYVTVIDDYHSFDRVLFAIVENDKVMNGRK